MKKCPVCNQHFTRSMILRRKYSQSATNLFGEFLTDGKGVMRCPHCKSRLRKKMSVWFLLALIPFIISYGIYVSCHRYEFLMTLSVVIFMIVYISLPYVPYDR